MEQNYQIDKLDRQILEELRKDARTPFTDIAKKLIVSGGTIHQRVNKMTEAGIIKGSTVLLDPQQMGLDVVALLGIHLKSAKDGSKVIEKLRKMPEVVEVYYTTGTYALIIKIMTKNIRAFHLFLSERLQGIGEVQSTESFICLDSPVQKDIPIL